MNRLNTSAMKKYKVLTTLLIAFLLLVFNCSSNPIESASSAMDLNANSSETSSGKVFELLSASTTGVEFNNELVETEEINFYRYEYLYNGGGVGIGDINNDGLSDLYFTGTVANDKLYLNKGNMKFEDITLSAGIQQDNGLKTGVSMVDINSDGLLDIYVSRSGWFETPAKRANLLYINQGNNTFKESAQDYGLAETGNTVQTGFFDYDKDGDLDCYVANHPLFQVSNKDREIARQNPPNRFRDKLYRNNGNNTFSEVSKAAGINNYGHGLGLAISDYNMDGWPDVYVANDFKSHDFYYINNGDGTFTEKAKELIAHVSYFAMGSDAADINNDGLLDLFVVEMLAEDNKRQKTNMASMNPDLFWDNVNRGYHYQFMRNTLQLNNGQGSFSDIAYLSGLANTDWSWAPLFADFDHDGKKDLAITNGYLRDTQDKDYVKKAKKMGGDKGLRTFSELAPLMKSTPIRNYVYKNEGDFRFSNRSTEWGFDFSGFSNGMAYGDLDNDGDLDLVVNNFNDPASIYKNTISDRKVGHYLQVALEGPAGNLNGLGAKLSLTTNNGLQFQEFWAVRGFESSCDQKIHFGVAEGDEIRELKVEWPDGKTQVLIAPESDQLLQIKYKEAKNNAEAESSDQAFFRRVGPQGGYMFTHKENSYDDYVKEILLPHKQSQNGPKITVGDVNGDQLDDFYIGGAAGQAGMLIMQVSGMQFVSTSSPTFQADAAYEDLGGTFFDADGDGDQDLYVVSGGNEFAPDSPLLQDRIYLNDGTGKFDRDRKLLPELLSSGGVVKASDVDGDGDQDLFVGGRIIPGKYPYSPRSYILRNDGGKFIDATESVAPELKHPGLITSAIWSDFSGDGIEDLIVVGEWTGVLMFENQNGILKNISKENGLELQTGWWNKIVAVDLDKDGDQDYVLGNLGLNYKYHASFDEPFEVYAHDFDDNGTTDIVLGYYNQGTCYPVRGRQCSSEQMPMIADKFKTYEEFGMADIHTVYGDELKEALHLKAHNFASSILLNEGGGKFSLTQLPNQAQIAPVNGIIATDFDRNGTIDLLLAGNLFQAEIETGRADAGRGLLMLGDGKGNFNPVSQAVSGLFAPMDVKDLGMLYTGPNQPRILLVANNNFGMQTYAETLARGPMAGPNK